MGQKLMFLSLFFTLLAFFDSVYHYSGMKPVFENVRSKDGGSFACLQFRGPEFECPYHYHPEFEITWILSSEG
ncbi:MAG: hypothetical protein EBT95_01920, partial [Verrucomicrobia bacterium]|nr:hypothetical protein [Verrucomicrobiota bacterium]